MRLQYSGIRKKVERFYPILICLGLVALVLGIYGQTLHHDFLNYDDNEYVTENPIVLQGLTLAGVKYAFASVCEVNWIPITVLVNMMDCQLYGNWAGGHHLTCLLLHALGAVLLFLLLRQMTGALWKSAFVAALWAVHPLRVESVAWIAELKDVLSGVFFFLTLIAYVDYTRRRTTWRYLLVMVLLALGLMSKPMLVTLPFVLLLLDFWPLRRTQGIQLLALVLEKLPLLGLSGISVMTTLWAQKSAIGDMAHMPFSLRIENAIMAYGAYLKEMIWPFGLALYHPIDPEGPPFWQVALVFLALTGITLWVVRNPIIRPSLLVGWFWYLGMLVPVIGLLKVGNQAYSDRYTYLPMIGILIAIVWGVGRRKEWMFGMKSEGPRLLHGMTKHVRMTTILLSILIITLATQSWREVRRWANSATLWQETLDAIGENDMALMNMGEVLMQHGKIKEAEGFFRRALVLNPAGRESLSNLAATLSLEGRQEEAKDRFRELIRLDPSESGSHNNLGTILLGQGLYDEALAEFHRAAELDGNERAQGNLATTLLRMGRLDEAAAEFHTLLKSNPVSPILHNNLGSVFLGQGRIQDAIAEFREALRIDPTYPTARKNLDQALLRQEAIQKSAR
jgi:Flp pilus assembly protein TadD